MRRIFFFFTYSYWCKDMDSEANGKGNLSITSSDGFPKRKDVTQQAIKLVSEKLIKPEYTITIVIENWIEMNEFDFNQWLAK